MEVGAEGGRIVIKLEQEEDFLPSLEAVLRENNVNSGVVLGGIGALKDFELGWFDPDKREYVKTHHGSSHELLSLQGTVTLGADPPLHVHASLGDERQAVVGGHLFRATVAVLAEVTVQVLEDLHLTRELNPKTGLKELTFGGR